MTANVIGEKRAPEGDISAKMCTSGQGGKKKKPSKGSSRLLPLAPSETGPSLITVGQLAPSETGPSLITVGQLAPAECPSHL
jgi:hypothetical protein